MMGTMKSNGTRSGKSLIDQKSVAMKRDQSKGMLSNKSGLGNKSEKGSITRRNTKELSKSPSGNQSKKSLKEKKLSRK